MMRIPFALIGAAALICAAATPAPAQDSDTVARLRDALRSTTTQLRTLQDSQAELEAKQAASSRENQALRDQIADLTKQLGAGGPKKTDQDREQIQQAEAQFNQRLAADAENLEKWKAAYNDAVNVARGKEADRAKLASEADSLTQRAESCEAKNAALFKIGNEILDRYAGMDFSDALGAREPFIGTKRVELQNIAQDYQDKLLDQKAAATQ